jgi:hypothetical protein
MNYSYKSQVNSRFFNQFFATCILQNKKWDKREHTPVAIWHNLNLLNLEIELSYFYAFHQTALIFILQNSDMLNALHK